MDAAQEKISEIVSIDGYKVILRYTSKPQPKVLENIQDILLNQKITPTK